MTVFFLIGISLVIYGFSKIYQLYKICHYEKTTASIEDAELISFKRKEVYVEIIYHEPKVAYRYRVSGKEYLGSMVFPYKKYITFSDEVKAQKFLENIKVQVAFYDVNNPSRSVLIRPSAAEIAQKDGGPLIAGILLVILYFLVDF